MRTFLLILCVNMLVSGCTRFHRKDFAGWSRNETLFVEGPVNVNKLQRVVEEHRDLIEQCPPATEGQNDKWYHVKIAVNRNGDVLPMLRYPVIMRDRCLETAFGLMPLPPPTRRGRNSMYMITFYPDL